MFLSLATVASASPQVFHVETDVDNKLLTAHGYAFGATPGKIKIGQPQGDTWVELPSCSGPTASRRHSCPPMSRLVLTASVSST